MRFTPQPRSSAPSARVAAGELEHRLPGPHPAPLPPGGRRPPVKGHGLLEGKVVVITAAAGTGIGGAAARRCLEEGASVAISDQHARRLAATREELAEAHAGLVWSQSCDVTDEEQVAALIEGAAGHFGRIDVLINNAGLGGTSSVLDMTDEQWLRVLDVTLNGTFRCTRAALRQMVAQGHGGAVVNNASVLGWRAQPGQAHYAAAKAGVMAFTRCAALDVAGHGIRVNAVAPSLAIHPFLAKVTDEDLLAELAGREAFGRAAEPWEVANVMVFLASDLAGYMTGEVRRPSSSRASARNCRAGSSRGQVSSVVTSAHVYTVTASRTCHRRSMMVAVAIAPPAHMVISAVAAPRRSSSCSAVVSSRAPVLPTGWPRAIAPPLTLTRSGSGSVHGQPGQHHRRERLVDLEQVDVADRHAAAGEHPLGRLRPGRPGGSTARRRPGTARGSAPAAAGRATAPGPPRPAARRPRRRRSATTCRPYAGRPRSPA